jgi:hypothetical protein
MVLSKVEICVGLVDLPSPGAVPEALAFGLVSMKRYEETVLAAHHVLTKIPSRLQLSHCACCDIQSTADTIEIQRRTKCKGVG